MLVLSVFSHENEPSLSAILPKWPYAAVFSYMGLLSSNISLIPLGLKSKLSSIFLTTNLFLSIYVDLFDNDEEKNVHVEKLINENFDLSPRGIREMLGLNKAIYQKTAAYGHFGREPESDGSFSWEKTDKSGIFK